MTPFEVGIQFPNRERVPSKLVVVSSKAFFSFKKKKALGKKKPKMA